MTLSLPAGTEVTLLYVGGATPLVIPATVARAEGALLELTLATPAALAAQARLILELPAGHPVPRALVEVVVCSGAVLVARLSRVPARETREYPRLEGRVEVAYRIAARREEGETWLREGTASGVERVPDPFMSFSAKGLAFDGGADAAEGDLLLLSLGLPDAPERWRATARVLRVQPIEPGEREPGAAVTHRTVVLFEGLPAAAAAALAAYTARIQERLLGEEGA